MKTMNISMSFSVNNGEWDDGKKIEREGKFSHSIDLGLFNDHSTFECVLSTLKREFEFTLENALNTVMQRMIDNKPDAAEPKEDKTKSNSSEPSDEQLSKMEMTRDEWNAQNLDNMLVPKSTKCEKIKKEKAE